MTTISNNDSMTPARMVRPEPRHLTAQRTFQGIPGIEITPKGRLWAVWYTGGKDEGPENFVVLVTSDDQGRTWTDAVRVVEHPGANVRSYDPTLWLDPTGKLWCFWAQCFTIADGTISDGVGGVWGAYLLHPDDADPVWSEPVRIANGVMMNKPTVLKNGDWAFPTALWKAGLGGGDVKTGLTGQCGANLTRSRDQGRTFEFVGGVDVPSRCFDEHMIIEKQDGQLWMLVRTDYGIGQSFSSDGGRTWSPGEDSRLGGPNSRFFIRRLASGRLLLVNHADISAAEAMALFREGKTWRSRKKLTAFLSDDDGQTWKGGLVLDERDGVSYPDGTQDAQGLIYVIYDHERHKKGDILMAVFRETDVLAGICQSPDAGLRILVNCTTP